MPLPLLAEPGLLTPAAKARPYFEIINPEIVTAGDRLGRGLNLLDVGCGSGMHALALSEALDWRSFGVDNSAVSIAKARSRKVDACVGDVYHPSEYRFDAAPRDGFDVLLFSDILEHLTSPLQVLQSHIQLLAPGGAVIVSIPNIAIWHARLRLLLGKWQYEDTGTFDRTHLVFFTRRTILELIDAAGLAPVYSRISPGIARPFVPIIKNLYSKARITDDQPDSSSILDSKPYRMYQKWLYPVESLACRLWPTLLAFQFIVVCQRKEAQMTTPEISVVMITMNEEKAVTKVIEDIRSATAGRSVEVLIVDSSRDRTPEIATELGARVLRQFPPQGYGRAMYCGLREARGSVVVTLDCDDTYPADQIVPLADMVLSGSCDVVNASRLERRSAAMPLANYAANAVFALTSRLLTGVRTTDVHSGMRAYSRRVLREIEFDASGPALPVELLLKPAVLGFRVTEVFIDYRDRIGVSTLQKWSSTLWTFKRILRCFALRGLSQPHGGAGRA